MSPTIPPLPTEVWRFLCEQELVRPAVVAAGRAQVATNDWPTPLEVAAALLDGLPHRFTGIG